MHRGKYVPILMPIDESVRRVTHQEEAGPNIQNETASRLVLSGVAIRAIGVYAIGAIHNLDTVDAVGTLRFEPQGFSARTHTLAQTLQDGHRLFPGDAGICVQRADT